MVYDFVIVGAGSAGAALAGRLTANPNVNVALLEAGPSYCSVETPWAMQEANPSRIIHDPAWSAYRWDALHARRTRRQPSRPYCRGRGMGGSSAINGQIAIRAVAEDFANWVEEGCVGWSYDDVLPAFNRLEDDLLYGPCVYHGDRGPIPIYRAPISRWGAVDQALAEAALNVGHTWTPDHNAPYVSGVSPYAINSRDGRRVSTNDAYLEPARDRTNLAIFADTLVHAVLIEGDLAIGVVGSQHGGRVEFLAREIVLCAGAIHSPGILMRSGIGPERDLVALGQKVVAPLPVGANLQDHPVAFIPIALRASATPPEDFRHTNVCVRYSSGFGAGAGPNDMMMVALNRRGDTLGSHLPDGGAVLGMVGVWVNQCFSRGTVRLASLDPNDQPIVDENMLDDVRDRARLREGVRQLVAMCESECFQSIGRAMAPTVDSDHELDDWLLESIGDTQHATSTCRMGNSRDERSVVDPDCRVIGLRGLRVVDASIMPSVVRANTHLTAVMLGEHMAAQILAAL